MKLRMLGTFVVVLSLGACASVPPPPHCEDSGDMEHFMASGAKPINPEMLSQEELNASQTATRKHGQEQPQGRAGRGGIN